MTSINTFTYLAINQRDANNRAACFYHHLTHTKVTSKAVTSTRNTRLNKLASIKCLLRWKPEMINAVTREELQRPVVPRNDDITEFDVGYVAITLVRFLPLPDHGPYLMTRLEEFNWYLQSMGFTENITNAELMTYLARNQPDINQH